MFFARFFILFTLQSVCTVLCASNQRNQPSPAFQALLEILAPEFDHLAAKPHIDDLIEVLKLEFDHYENPQDYDFMQVDNDNDDEMMYEEDSLGKQVTGTKFKPIHSLNLISVQVFLPQTLKGKSQSQRYFEKQARGRLALLCQRISHHIVNQERNVELLGKSDLKPKQLAVIVVDLLKTLCGMPALKRKLSIHESYPLSSSDLDRIHNRLCLIELSTSKFPYSDVMGIFQSNTTTDSDGPELVEGLLFWILSLALRVLPELLGVKYRDGMIFVDNSRFDLY